MASFLSYKDWHSLPEPSTACGHLSCFSDVTVLPEQIICRKALLSRNSSVKTGWSLCYSRTVSFPQGIRLGVASLILLPGSWTVGLIKVSWVPGWPWTHGVAKNDLELEILATLRMLRLQVYSSITTSELYSSPRSCNTEWVWVGLYSCSQKHNFLSYCLASSPTVFIVFCSPSHVEIHFEERYGKWTFVQICHCYMFKVYL